MAGSIGSVPLTVPGQVGLEGMCREKEHEQVAESNHFSVSWSFSQPAESLYYNPVYVLDEVKNLQLGLKDGRPGLCDESGQWIAPLGGIDSEWEGTDEGLREMVALQEEVRAEWSRLQTAVLGARPNSAESGEGMWKLGGSALLWGVGGLLFGLLPMYVPIFVVWVLLALGTLLASGLIDLRTPEIIEEARGVSEEDGSAVSAMGAPRRNVEEAAILSSLARIPLARLSLGFAVVAVLSIPLGLDGITRMGVAASFGLAMSAWALSAKARVWLERVRTESPGIVCLTRPEGAMKVLNAREVDALPSGDALPVEEAGELALRPVLCLVGEGRGRGRGREGREGREGGEGKREGEEGEVEQGDTGEDSFACMGIAVGEGVYLVPDDGSFFFKEPEIAADFALREILPACGAETLLPEGEVNRILREV